jgi:Fe2+ or Zn2+ uptake regulation protein
LKSKAPQDKTGNSRLTRSARSVLEALEALHHATAQEICDWILAQSESRKVSLTSTYRALNQLSALGHIKPLNFQDGQLRYELIGCGHHHHHHLICTGCERVQILEECPFDLVLSRLPEQFQVQYHNFEIFGLCKNCQ